MLDLEQFMASMFAESTTPAVDAAMIDLEEFMQKSKGRKWGEAEEEEAQSTIDFLDEVMLYAPIPTPR